MNKDIPGYMKVMYQVMSLTLYPLFCRASSLTMDPSFNIDDHPVILIYVLQLFVKFRGPSTILVQSRAARLRDVLSKQEVNDIAITEPGSLETFYDDKAAGVGDVTQRKVEPLTVKMASIQPSGKVEFEDSTPQAFIR